MLSPGRPFAMRKAWRLAAVDAPKTLPARRRALIHLSPVLLLELGKDPGLCHAFRFLDPLAALADASLLSFETARPSPGSSSLASSISSGRRLTCGLVPSSCRIIISNRS